MRRFDVRTWFSVALVFFFIIFEAAKFFTPQGIYSPILIGKKFITRTDQSPLISSKAAYTSSLEGYDGQFFYYISLDPKNAHYYIDDAGYRYQRIFYPYLARILSFGHWETIPYLLMIINILAVTSSVALIGLWLKKNGISPYFALIYGFYPGLHFSTQRDLSEPLAYFLVIVGTYIYSSKIKNNYFLSSLAFSLAILTREAVFLFPLAFSLADIGTILKNKVLLKHKNYVFKFLNLKMSFAHSFKKLSYKLKSHNSDGTNINSVILFILITFLPFALYKLYLTYVLGFKARYGLVYLFTFYPFGGLIQNLSGNYQLLMQIFSVVLPAIIMGSLGIYLLTQNKTNKYLLALFLNIIVLIIFLGPASYIEYIASGRISTGVILASLLCLPTMIKFQKRLLIIFMIVVSLWLSAWKLIPLFYPLRLNLIIPVIALILTLKFARQYYLGKIFYIKH